jgi:hypothetical protein
MALKEEGILLGRVRIPSLQANHCRWRLRMPSRTNPASETPKMAIAMLSLRIRLILSRKTSASLRCGKGLSGTSTPRNSLSIDAPRDAVAEENHHRFCIPTDHHIPDLIQF